MLDSDLKAWLLEINMSPCMDQYVCQKQMACGHKDCPISPVDQYVKKTVLFDAINLMVRLKDLGGGHLLGDRYRSMTRVFPGPKADHKEIYDKIKDLRFLFLTITKGKNEMTSNQFVQTFKKSTFLRQQCGIRQADL